MTNGELMNMMISAVRDYKQTGVMASVIRNSHMNEYEEYMVTPSQEAIDAILVDFVNYFAATRCGMDLGLYTRDIQ